MIVRPSKLFGVVLVLLLGACSSGVRRDEAHGSYQYRGEKFGKISSRLSPELAADPEKIARFNQLRLGEGLVGRMQAAGLYDPASANSVEIVINGFRFRHGASAVMWGAMAGADYVEGVVTLKAADDKVLNSFAVKASYALGGFAGGQDHRRIDYLGRQFSEHTVNSMLNK